MATLAWPNGARCLHAHDGAVLDRVFERMQESGCRAIRVVRDGHLVGVVTLENVGGG